MSARSWPSRLGQSAQWSVGLVARSTDPRRRREPVALRVLGVPSGSCGVGQVPRRSVAVRVPVEDLPGWLGSMCRLDVSLSTGAAVLLGGVLSPDRAVADGDTIVLHVESVDALVRRAGLESARSISGGALGVVGNLVREVIADVHVASGGVSDVPVRAYDASAGDDSRWRVIEELSAMLGADLGATAGGGLMLRPVSPRGAPWLVREGIECGALAPALSAQPNVVIVEGESGAAGMAVDDRPWSAHYLGPRARHFASSDQVLSVTATPGFAPPFTRMERLPVSSGTDARLAARALMVRGRREADQELVVSVNPALEWGDPLTWMGRDGSVAALVVTGFDLPFGATQRLTVRSA